MSPHIYRLLINQKLAELRRQSNRNHACA